MKRFAVHSLAWAIPLLAACAHATQPEASIPAASMPAAGIALREPRPGLFSAGQPAPTDWQAIHARGVGTVVNLRTPEEMRGRHEAVEVRAAGMRYVSIPVAGMDGVDDANADALREALRNAQGAVLVHCASGNRAGGLLALEQARSGGMPPEEALAFGRSAGMTGTEARVRSLLERGDARCRLASSDASATGGSAKPERCP